MEHATTDLHVQPEGKAGKIIIVVKCKCAEVTRFSYDADTGGMQRWHPLADCYQCGLWEDYNASS